MRPIFDFDDYKVYLNEALDSETKGGRGARSRLSREIGIQTAYTAQVLRGSAHFSLEQAELINDFLGHTEDEGQFFILLVQTNRAALPKLRERFKKQIIAIRENRLVLKNRLGVGQSLSGEDQVTYYSTWYYVAIHVLMSIPGFQTIQAAATALQLNQKTVSEALEFLVRVGLVIHKDHPYANFEVGNTRIHLGAESPLIAKHHMNWRLQAMRSIELRQADSLHYSSVVSVSEQDAVLIREQLIRQIESAKLIIRDSQEERLQCLSVDFFKV